MKAKYLVLGICAVVGLAGVWVGRMAWRAHRQLVTLDVREMPLRDVLRKVERQTWKKIRIEKALDARITLRVTDKPLTYVLDRLAEQAGARWSTLYAVYDSAAAFRALDSALRGDGKLEPAGWTMIAPKLPAPDTALPNEAMQILGSPANPNAGPAGPMHGERRMMVTRRVQGASVSVAVTGGANGRVEVWSPQELVMPSSLTNRLAGDHSQAATPEAAAAAARELKGTWTTLLAFRKSSMGIGEAASLQGQLGLDPVKHSLNDRFARLTPAQRVQRARQRLQPSEK